MRKQTIGNNKDKIIDRDPLGFIQLYSSHESFEMKDYVDYSVGRCFKGIRTASKKIANLEAVVSVPRGCRIHLPEMATFSGEIDIVMAVSKGSQNIGCGQISDRVFRDPGGIPPTHLFTLDEIEPGVICYIAGTITIHAGVMRNALVRKNPPKRLVDILRAKNLEPDRWVLPAFDTLPLLVEATTRMNTTHVRSGWNTTDEYVRSVLHTAYSVAWETFDTSLSPLIERISIPVSALEVKISQTPLFLWLFTNLLFPLSGVLHIILQSTCSRPVIIDTATVALTTDVSKLLADPDVKKLQWRNMSYVTKQDAFMDTDQPKTADSGTILLKLGRGEDWFLLKRKNG
jgi:hypothetical protein